MINLSFNQTSEFSLTAYESLTEEQIAQGLVMTITDDETRSSFDAHVMPFYSDGRAQRFRFYAYKIPSQPSDETLEDGAEIAENEIRVIYGNATVPENSEVTNEGLLIVIGTLTLESGASITGSGQTFETDKATLLSYPPIVVNVPDPVTFLTKITECGSDYELKSANVVIERGRIWTNPL